MLTKWRSGLSHVPQPRTIVIRASCEHVRARRVRADATHSCAVGLAVYECRRTALSRVPALETAVVAARIDQVFLQEHALDSWHARASPVYIFEC